MKILAMFMLVGGIVMAVPERCTLHHKAKDHKIIWRVLEHNPVLGDKVIERVLESLPDNHYICDIQVVAGSSHHNYIMILTHVR